MLHANQEEIKEVESHDGELAIEVMFEPLSERIEQSLKLRCPFMFVSHTLKRFRFCLGSVGFVRETIEQIWNDVVVARSSTLLPFQSPPQ